MQNAGFLPNLSIKTATIQTLQFMVNIFDKQLTIESQFKTFPSHIFLLHIVQRQDNTKKMVQNNFLSSNNGLRST
jgi:hypothetical protein